MHHHVVAGLLLVATGCSGATDQPSPLAAEPPASASHPEPTTPDASGTDLETAPDEDPPTTADTDAAAAAQVLLTDAFVDEGLTVLDLRVLDHDRTDTTADVTVEVLHTVGHGHPTRSTYSLELHQQHGQWRLASYQDRS